MAYVISRGDVLYAINKLLARVDDVCSSKILSLLDGDGVDIEIQVCPHLGGDGIEVIIKEPFELHEIITP